MYVSEDTTYLVSLIMMLDDGAYLLPGQDKDEAMMIISLNLVDISSDYHYQRYKLVKASSSMRECIKNLIFISLK